MNKRKLVVSFLPIAGCFWQVYYISLAYFSYSSLSEITQLKQATIKPPTFVFCVYAEDSIQRFSKRKNFTGLADIKSPDDYLSFFEELKDDLIDFFVYQPLLREKEISSLNRSLLESHMFYHDEKACFSFSYREPTFKPYNNVTTWKQFLVIYPKNWFLGNAVTVAFLASDLSPFFCDDEINNKLEISQPTFEDNSTTIYSRLQVELTFEELQLELLAFPFETDCLDYQESLKVRSKAYCYHYCLNQLSMNRETAKKSIHRNSFILPYSKDLSIPFAPSFDDVYVRLEGQEKSKCVAKCSKPDCKLNSFKAIQNEPSMFYKSRNEFALLFPTKPKLKIVYKPQLSLIDFITYVLSCVSFWLGFSPLPFLIELKIVKGKTGIQSAPNPISGIDVDNQNRLIRSSQLQIQALIEANSRQIQINSRQNQVNCESNHRHLECEVKVNMLLEILHQRKQ